MLEWRRARDFGRVTVTRTEGIVPRVEKLRSIAFEIACFLSQLAFALSELILFLLELQLCEFFDALSPPPNFIFAYRRITTGLASGRIMINHRGRNTTAPRSHRLIDRLISRSEV
jgi:hypothetical protein